MEVEGGKAALISHTIGNPDRKLAGFRAIDEMMGDIKEWGLASGYIAFMCLTTSRLLAHTYNRHGFALAENGVNQYILS